MISVLLRPMRLRKIKLSGFKSFVDPTTLIVPANLVGIVGPNGCGKSNIIDAVMWVMGESSAKHLRGDALTDVIFNGSTARNPVGQASVELIFDNTEGKIGGQYASYDEISIKRQINRDAISSYYLNGTRCRRRDIQAIFLGTGLGPRSYAIIEQGMISRLIEAKPDELRTFIEEAAGISKYRERRRETENRIRNTRDNIARLNDIREELEKQLNHLNRQAKAAERYQVLKQDQRQLEAELLALNWKHLKQVSDQEQQQIRENQNRVEAELAKLREIENEIVKERDNLTAANEEFNVAQSNFYQIGSDISQLEQKLHHINEKLADTENEVTRNKNELNSITAQIQQDEAKLTELLTRGKELEPQLQGSRADSDRAYSSLNDSEQAMQSWQTEWETFNNTLSGYTRDLEVGQARSEHLELSIEDLVERESNLQKELDSVSRNALTDDVKQYTQLQADAEQQVSHLQKQIETSKHAVNQARKSLQELNDQLNEKRTGLQKLEGRKASLEALQQSAMDQGNEQTAQWLKQLALDTKSRLANTMKVDDKWMPAVETVLGTFLQDICIDDINQVTDKIRQLDKGNIGFVGAEKFVDVDTHSRFPSLAEKISGKFPLLHLLANIYIAENYDEALALRANLTGHETVITPDGTWMGVNWIHVHHQADATEGVLTREQEIKRINKSISELEAQLEQLQDEINKQGKTCSMNEQEHDELQVQLNSAQETLAQHRSQLANAEGQLRQLDANVERIRDELDSVREQLAEEQDELANVKKRISNVTAQVQDFEAHKTDLVENRDKYRQSLTSAREQWQKTHEFSHEIALKLESISSHRASLEQSIKRSETQRGHLQGRISELQQTLQETGQPVDHLKQQLDARVGDKSSAEKLLNEVRGRVQNSENIVREKELARNEQEGKVQECRETLEKSRLATQESVVRLQTIEEKLAENGQQPQTIINGMDESAELPAWKEKLENTNQKIHRLGPINLAAIDEYSQLSERKTYLDKQDEDLREALSTLENAIHKIDKESRTRFRETFDQLNNNLQETFPVLFGGGNAYLELIGEDLLETGVTIMARPPGKKNSTIHLLSGGEKALTAVALVFSIFKLNPAPFCILDEVDAPLDDANVGRFSDLVASMSEDVQFIFITHNKITMEIAHQLLGVTMYEAGVSRLVSVDVDEAVKMAATA